MEGLVESYIRLTGFEYKTQVKTQDVERDYGVDLSEITAKQTNVKKFDFVVKGDSQIFVIEVNFYGSGGSKLNETARSYKMIAEERKKNPWSIFYLDY